MWSSVLFTWRGLYIDVECCFDQAKVAWGAECKEFSTMVTAETGLIVKSPAARLTVSWEQLPTYFRTYAKL